MELVSCSHDTLNTGKLGSPHQRSLLGQTRDQLIDSLSRGGDQFSAAAEVEVSVFAWKEDDSQIEEVTPTKTIMWYN